MLFNHVHVFAASLVFVVPYLQDCDCEFDPGVAYDDGGEGGDDGGYCEPYEEDGQCRSCLRTTCCEGIDACEDNRACSCVVDCMSVPGGDVAACASERCNVDDVNLALAPLTRWCSVTESCGEPRYCEVPEELPTPQFQ